AALPAAVAFGGASRIRRSLVGLHPFRARRALRPSADPPRRVRRGLRSGRALGTRPVREGAALRCAGPSDGHLTGRSLVSSRRPLPHENVAGPFGPAPCLWIVSDRPNSFAIVTSGAQMFPTRAEARPRSARWHSRPNGTEPGTHGGTRE